MSLIEQDLEELRELFFHNVLTEYDDYGIRRFCRKRTKTKTHTTNEKDC